MKKILSIFVVLALLVGMVFSPTSYARNENALSDGYGTPSLLGVFNGETKRLQVDSSGFLKAVFSGGNADIDSIQGNTLIVGPNGTYTTITLAMAAVVANDTILVTEGTYTETVTFTQDNITLKAIGSKENTTITQVTATVIDFGTKSGCVLEGFTINVSAANNSNQHCIKGSNDDALDYNFIIDCDIIWSSSATITDSYAIRVGDGNWGFNKCLILAINTNSDAAIRTIGGLFFEQPNANILKVINCDFVVTTSATGATFSTGIFLGVGTVEIRDCTFDIDAAGTGDSRGIANFTSAATVNIYNSQIVCDNSSSGDSVIYAAAVTGGTFNSYGNVLDASGGTNQWWSETVSGATVNSYHDTILDGTINDAGTTNVYVQVDTNNLIFHEGGVLLPGMKSGTDQSNAGAATGELYVDTNDDNTVKRGV